MQRARDWYVPTPEDRRVEARWARRVVLLYGTIVLVAFAVMFALRPHQQPDGQASAANSAVASAATNHAAARPR
jgi:hypothetical protein